MVVGEAHVFPGLTNATFFPKPPTTFPTCFCRDERQKYAGKKFCLNHVSNSQPPGDEYDRLITEPLGLLTLSQTSPGFYVSAVQVF